MTAIDTSVSAPKAPVPFDPGNWGKIVDVPTIKKVHIPVQGPITWRPMPHDMLIDMIEQTFNAQGFTYSEPVHYLAPARPHKSIPDLGQHGRFLSMYGLAHPLLPTIEGLSWELGAMNALDMSTSVKLGAGDRIAVCSNGMFSAEFMVRRKHTVGIDRDRDAHFEQIRMLVVDCISKILEKANRRAEQIRVFQRQECTDSDARYVIIEAAKTGVIGAAATMKVLKHWEDPEHPEFKDRNVWSLQNAFTSNDRGRNLFTQPDRFQQLSGIMNQRFGFNAVERTLKDADFAVSDASEF